MAARASCSSAMRGAGASSSPGHGNAGELQPSHDGAGASWRRELCFFSFSSLHRAGLGTRLHEVLRGWPLATGAGNAGRGAAQEHEHVARVHLTCHRATPAADAASSMHATAPSFTNRRVRPRWRVGGPDVRNRSERWAQLSATIT